MRRNPRLDLLVYRLAEPTLLFGWGLFNSGNFPLFISSRISPPARNFPIKPLFDGPIEPSRSSPIQSDNACVQTTSTNSRGLFGTLVSRASASSPWYSASSSNTRCDRFQKVGLFVSFRMDRVTDPHPISSLAVPYPVSYRTFTSCVTFTSCSLCSN